MACLRAADATDLEAANINITEGSFFGTFTLVSVIDDHFIIQRPTASLMKGKVNGEALLAVTNTFEGTDFVNQKVSVAASQYALELFPGFGTAQADTAGSLYADLGNDLFQVNAVQEECASTSQL